MRRHDFISLADEKATVSAKGWVFDDPVLTRSGVFVYTRADGSKQREYRPPEEVFHADSLASLFGIPFVVDHPSGSIVDDKARPIVGSVISNGRQDGNDLRAKVVIHRFDDLGDRREVSLGYDLDIEEKPGTTPQGEPYDVVQKNIRYDHVAGVRRGRAGNARLRLDSEDAAMGDVEIEGSNMTKIRLDSGVEFEVAPEVAHQIATTKAALDTTSASLAALQATATADKARADDAAAQLAAEKAKEPAIRADAIAKASARIGVESIATAQGVAFAATDTDRVIRENVVKKMRGDAAVDFTGKDDTYVTAIYDLVLGDARRADANFDENARRMANGGGNGGANPPAPPPSGNSRADADKAYDKYTANLSNAWKDPK